MKSHDIFENDHGVVVIDSISANVMYMEIPKEIRRDLLKCHGISVPCLLASHAGAYFSYLSEQGQRAKVCELKIIVTKNNDVDGEVDSFTYQVKYDYK